MTKEQLENELLLLKKESKEIDKILEDELLVPNIVDNFKLALEKRNIKFHIERIEKELKKIEEEDESTNQPIKP